MALPLWRGHVLAAEFEPTGLSMTPHRTHAKHASAGFVFNAGQTRAEECQLAEGAASWLAKAVPDVAVGEQVCWIGRIILEFLTELTDEDAQIRAVGDKVWATQGAKQPRVGKRTARLGHEKLKRMNLARREMYLD